jgi:outer membrane protein assembly factor BamD
MSLRLAPYILLCALVVGCASTPVERRAKTAEEVYTEAMEAFKDENWVDAQGLFDIIKLQFPASQYADDAQYYLAEINFKRGEYILGAYNYAMVRRMYPSSEHAKDALYKSALCYVEMSPPSDRDQEYTKKAIAAFGEFESAFPRDSLTFEAAKQIRELRDKLAERYLESARHYVRARSNRAAVIYYDAVIDEYPDSRFYETALVEKASTLIDMRKYDDARSAIDTYRRTVRSGQMRGEIDRLEERLR